MEYNYLQQLYQKVVKTAEDAESKKITNQTQIREIEIKIVEIEAQIQHLEREIQKSQEKIRSQNDAINDLKL